MTGFPGNRRAKRALIRKMQIGRNRIRCVGGKRLGICIDALLIGRVKINLHLRDADRRAGLHRAYIESYIARQNRFKFRTQTFADRVSRIRRIPGNIVCRCIDRKS